MTKTVQRIASHGKNKSFRPQHTQTNLAKCPPINATSMDNRKLQCYHPNRKYLYLRQYDRHHYNFDFKPSISASSQKVSTGYHQRQPEITTWLPKPEIAISLELQLIASKFQRQVGYFWPLRVRIICPEVIVTMFDNRKSLRPLKPEILISLKPRQVGRQFRRQIWDFRPCPARRNWHRVIATTTDNRK